MTWFKVDDGLTFHRKALAAGNEALGVWVRAGAWSCANLTEGYIPPDAAKVIATSAKIWARLRKVGLTEAPPDGRPGEQLHDFLDYNLTAEQVRAQRKATKGRAQRWRDGRRNTVANGERNAVTNDDRTPAPIPSRPDPVPEDPHTHPAGAREGSGADPPEPPPSEDPGLGAIRAQLAALPFVAAAAQRGPDGDLVALQRLAEQLLGLLHGTGRPLAVLLEAVRAAAADEEHERGRGATWGSVAKRLRTYAAAALRRPAEQPSSTSRAPPRPQQQPPGGPLYKHEDF